MLWRKVKLLRCGDGELCIAGEKDVICLVKINGLLKALIQNVYPAPVLQYDTGYGAIEAEEVRIGIFAVSAVREMLWLRSFMEVTGNASRQSVPSARQPVLAFRVMGSDSSSISR